MATQYVTCPTCSTQNTAMNARCTNCGTVLPPISPMPMQHIPQSTGAALPGAEKKIAAGICGIVLGGLGIHKFILGYQQEGIILLAVYLVAIILTLVTCGIAAPLMFIPSVIGIIEGIIYLTKSDEEFVQTYIANKKPWF
ncbi:MAG TPA: TM2 domain-containing protein [Pyrinomonadaceae bacterium]|jgi:TM2 domain-containing membrane protein YozV|nr:TM2 domain-containing protein [Pyrinomonadaceae bacterium]